MKLLSSVVLIFMAVSFSHADLDVDSLTLEQCTEIAIKNSVELKGAQNRVSVTKLDSSRRLWDALRPSIQVGPNYNLERDEIGVNFSGGMDILAPFGPVRWQRKADKLALLDSQNQVLSTKNRIVGEVSQLWQVHHLNLAKLSTLKGLSETISAALAKSITQKANTSNNDLMKVIIIYIMQDTSLRIMDVERDVISSREALARRLQI